MTTPKPTPESANRALVEAAREAFPNPCGCGSGEWPCHATVTDNLFVALRAALTTYEDRSKTEGEK